MKKTTITAIIALAMLAIPLAYALSTTTTVNFNVATLVAYTLTLPGESAVSATGPGAATTAIEFNSSTGTAQDVHAKVVGGASQSEGTPIFSFDNTGTVDINLSVILDSNTPACIALRGATTAAGANASTPINSTGNTTVVNNFTPAAGTQDWYMKADFTACTASDSASRTVTSWGVQS